MVYTDMACIYSYKYNVDMITSLYIFIYILTDKILIRFGMTLETSILIKKESTSKII